LFTSVFSLGEGILVSADTKQFYICADDVVRPNSSTDIVITVSCCMCVCMYVGRFDGVYVNTIKWILLIGMTWNLPCVS